jgi:hypothetical protein
MIVRFRAMSDGGPACLCGERGCRWGWMRGARAVGPLRAVEVADQQPCETFERFQERLQQATRALRD